MNKKFTFLKVVSVFLMGMFLSFSGIAQVTTSSMSGRVTDGSKEAVAGATVVATHVPSQTTYGVMTNADGRFTINGMRVGGPYKVSITSIGYGENVKEGITLALGENYIHNVTLSEESITLSDVVVSGTRTSFTTEKTGASTNISNTQLSTMPTISRSIGDIAQLSPYSGGGMSIAGGDGRSTNFTVNGANFNNNFGLSSALPGGGNPISLDAIEEIQVVVAPFDVRQTNFIGGGINAITKSGTNKFRGTAYSYYNNQNMRGNKIGDVDFGDRLKESKRILGATFGGPIIKNKLFFFANVEQDVRPSQVVLWRPSDDGVANADLKISRTKKSDMELVKQHLKDVYGYDAGSYDNYPGDISNFKWLGQLDWNISNAHRFRLTYNHTKNANWQPTNGNSTDGGYRNTAYDRISDRGMSFSNSLYSQDNIVNSVTGELNSRFSNKISNQFLATYTKINDIRGSNSSPFPFIDILAGRQENGTPIVEPYISAGYELFTWNNGVNNNVMTFTDNITYYMSKHKLTGGVSYEYQMANNAYMRNGTGYYRYASVDDFINQRAPIDFALTYGYAGESNPAAEVAFNQIGVYAQDEWNVSDKFKLTLGVRADNITYVDNLIRNNAIYNLDYDGKKIDTGSWPTSKVQVSPRLGFNWDVFGDKALKVRGGTGVFQGRLPLVFFTNMPTNAGMVQGSVAYVTRYNSALTEITSQDPKLAQLAGKMIVDPQEMISKLGLKNTISPEDGALPRDINGVDPNFKMPQVWKSSLAVDYQVPASFPMTLSVEGIYTKNIYGVMLENWDWKQPDASWQKLSGSDDRYIYPALAQRTFNNRNAYMLTNTSEGWGAIFNISATAQPVKNLNLMAAYTWTESKEVTGMPGSNAASAYQGIPTVNGPHLPIAQRSQYVVPHRVIGSIGTKVFNWNAGNVGSSTHINLFYTGSSGFNYSYMYTNDLNGDGMGNDLMYIPANRGDIKFISQADEDAFFKYMEGDKYLTKNKGKYAEAYAGRTPWVNNFDLKLVHEYYVGKSGGTKNTLQFIADILNVGNLINNKWGVRQTQYNTINQGRILKVENITSNVPTYSFVKVKGEYPTTPYDYNYSIGETWRLQLGVKYIFN